MSKQQKYVLTLDEQQYQDIIIAVKTFHCVICGQVEELKIGLFKISRETLMQLKREMFPELALNENYGWDGRHPDKKLDRLQAATYAIYREMLHVRTVDAKREGEYSGWSVLEPETLTCGKCKLPKIEIIKNQES